MTTTTATKLPPTDTGRCGEYAGLRRHERRGETPCEPCKQGRRERDNARRRAKGIPSREETVRASVLIEEIEFLIQCGEGEHRILQATGLKQATIERQLDRHKRRDLYHAIFTPRPGWVGN